MQSKFLRNYLQLRWNIKKLVLQKYTFSQKYLTRVFPEVIYPEFQWFCNFRFISRLKRTMEILCVQVELLILRYTLGTEMVLLETTT